MVLLFFFFWGGGGGAVFVGVPESEVRAAEASVWNLICSSVWGLGLGARRLFPSTHCSLVSRT